jgi:L,D-transpeptidase YcbB
MSRWVLKSVACVAALSVFAGIADAESSKNYRRKRGFFETLFGVRPDNQPEIYVTQDGQVITSQKRRRPAFDQFGNIIDYKDKKQTQTSFYGDVPKKKVKQAPAKVDYAEPEPLPGLGMGTLDYQPPLVIPVFDAGFAKRQTEDPTTEAIRLVLADKTTRIRAVDAERKAVLAFYGSANFKPMWTKDGRPTERAIAALKILSTANKDGLVPERYLPTVLLGFDQIDESLSGDPLKIATFDVSLTAKILEYARDLSGGQFDPARLSLYYDIKTNPVAADAALRVLAYSPYIENYLASLAPAKAEYEMFKVALSKLDDKAAKPVLEQIESGPRVKLGKTDPRIPAVRARLAGLGLITADDAVNNDEEKLDKPLSEGLKKFQSSNAIKVTGSLDDATVKAFNADRSDDERQRLIFNMERLRWLPKSMGNRYVFVNQPAFEVNVMDEGKSVWKSRVIVGRPLTQTYSFYDQIETVVFNPSWGVPASIIVNEYGPKSRKDPGYLDRQGFKIVDSNGNPMSSKSINWWTIGQTPNFGIQQPPGSDNALGELKFLFPNTHDIYMHDTPSRKLFSESVRSFSHGCVRVQNPREFAAVLLGWDAKKVDENVEMGDSHSVTLSQKVPVYLTYFTAWPDANGKIQYFNDIYGRDKAMAKAFSFGSRPKNSVNPDKIVQTDIITGGLTQN